VGRFVKGDIVVINFPFSDLTGSKRRPALVIADLDGDDIILCQITTHLNSDRYAIPIGDEDFEEGKLSAKVWCVQINYLRQIRTLFCTQLVKLKKTR